LISPEILKTESEGKEKRIDGKINS
jgi:hypothetical protein